MKGVRHFRDYLKDELKDPTFREAYEEEGVYAELAVQIARLRVQKKLSQKRLARLLHTSQQTVSRLEDPHNASYSVRTLVKIAHALGKELKVEFV
ncbi:MAG: XRE family transcriptional regulator [Candidatus Omnitrophica bacterium]|nr:XRE family transcriptional regulator [Candidatus Omnitrophota bacterium]